MSTMRELYNQAKQDPNAIIYDVGEAHPLIIHEAHLICEMKDGTKAMKVIYLTFEYVKKHVKELKACGCEICRDAVTAYRSNKKAMRGATPEEIETFMGADWVDADKEMLQ